MLALDSRGSWLAAFQFSSIDLKDPVWSSFRNLEQMCRFDRLTACCRECGAVYCEFSWNCRKRPLFRCECLSVRRPIDRVVGNICERLSWTVFLCREFDPWYTSQSIFFSIFEALFQLFLLTPTFSAQALISEKNCPLEPYPFITAHQPPHSWKSWSWLLFWIIRVF